MMHLTTEFWHFFCLRCVWWLRWWCWGGWGVSLSLPPLRVVSSLRSCALGVGAAGGGLVVGAIELWMEVKRGWGLASKGHTPLHPQHFRLPPPHPPTLPPSPLSLRLPSLPKQSPSTRGVRLDEGDWRCVSRSLSFWLSALPFFFLSCYTFVLISFFLSLPDFSWESQNDRGPFRWNWSADVEKTRQRHTVPWFPSSSNRLVVKLPLIAVVWFFLPLKTWKMLQYMYIDMLLFFIFNTKRSK